MRLSISTAAATLLASLVRAQSTTYPTFVNPPNLTDATSGVTASTYSVGDELTLQFTAPSWDSITIGIWLQYPQNNFLNLSKLPGAIGLTSSTTQFLWKIDFSGTNNGPNISLSDQSRFNFALFHQGTQEHIDSQYISIRNTASSSASPTSTGISSTASVTRSSLTSTPSNSVATATSTGSATATPTSAADDSSSGLSTGAKAGIGIGVGLGVLGLVAGIVAAILLYKRRQAPATTRPRPGSELDGTAYQPVYTQEQKPVGGYSEAPSGERPPSELPGEMGYSYPHR